MNIRHSARFYGGLFLITASTLMLQVVETRILSVMLWYHLAFFAISMAMFGLTAGALWVFEQKDRFTPETLPYYLSYFSLAYAVATVFSLLLQMTLALALPRSVTGIIALGFLAVYLAVPYFFAGLTISLALTRSPYPIGRVYGVDLLGAAIGCFGVLFLLNYVDGPSAILWVAVIAAAASLLFAWGVSSELQGQNSRSGFFRQRALIFIVLTALAIFNSFGSQGISPIIIKGKVEKPPSAMLHVAWNSFSRVGLYDQGKAPAFMWGPSPVMPSSWKIEQFYMTIDGDAATPIYRFKGDFKDLEFLKYDVTNLAYFLPNVKRAGIIGVGGGRDVLSARLFGVEEIKGVEINPILIGLLTRHPQVSTFAGFKGLQGAQLINDEARSWFARHNETFDLIQMSLVDTWAATGAGAFTLSENGLYTLEAWRTFLQKLTPQGVFTVSRWYTPNEQLETGRMISLAVASLLEMGAQDPKRHIFVASSRNIATLVLSRNPLSAESLGELEQAVARYNYGVLVSPTSGTSSVVLQNILNCSELSQLRDYTEALDLDLSPATDDRPFFFNQLKFSRLFRLPQNIKTQSGGVLSGNLIASMTLLTIFVISFILVLCVIVIPMWSAVQDVGTRLAFGGTAYFFLIGMGFMMVEIALLQRLSLFLGHPIYSLSVVLFSLILMTGLGSMVSDKARLNNSCKFIVWSLTTGGYLVLLPYWLPKILLAWDNAPLMWRGLLCVAVIAPAGFLMGFGFPTGMRLASAFDTRPTPWFWGINGAAGVLAASAAIFVSLAYGIGTALLVGGLCYPLLIPAALIIGFHGRRADE